MQEADLLRFLEEFLSMWNIHTVGDETSPKIEMMGEFNGKKFYGRGDKLIDAMIDLMTQIRDYSAQHGQKFLNVAGKLNSVFNKNKILR